MYAQLLLAVTSLTALAPIAAAAAQPTHEAVDTIPDTDGNGIRDVQEIERYYTQHLFGNYTQHLFRPASSLGTHEIVRVFDNGLVCGDRRAAMVDVVTGVASWTSEIFWAGLSFPEPDGCTSEGAVWQRGQVVVLDLSDGTVRWRATAEDLGVSRIEAVHEGGRVRGTWHWSVVDMSTGEVRFSTVALDDWVHRVANNRFWQTPIINLWDNGVLATAHGVARVDTADGSLMWQHPQLRARIGRIREVHADGRVRGEQDLAVIDPSSGELLWSTEGLEESIGGGGYFDAGGRVGGYRKGIVRFDLRTGEVLFSDRHVTDEQKRRLADLSIQKHARFYSADLIEHIIDTRSGAGLARDRPLAVVLYPRSDPNRAFQFNNLDDFLPEYSLLYYEIGDEGEFFSALRDVRRFGLTVSVVIIGGHSSREWLEFGGGGGDGLEDLTLDLGDERKLARWAPLFRGADIVIDGCSAGSAKGDNIARMIARSLGASAARVFAPTHKADSRMVFDEDGRFERPEYFLGRRQVGTLILRPGGGTAR